jgi:TRAP-type C4-dicarboxylate transport system permease small subunit
MSPDEMRSPPAATGLAGVMARVSFAIGSIALLTAMSADALAVVGRHLGLPLLGSIEIVQACIVIAASSAMVGATLGRSHAEVHILTERLSPRARVALKRISDLLSAIFFATLAIGSLWMAADLWGGHERTEMLHLPLAPLRLVWCASALLILSIFAGRAVAPSPKETHGDA